MSRGAYRTAIGYVLIVMGGLFLLVLPVLSLLANSEDNAHARYAHADVGALDVLGLHLKMFFRITGSWMVIIWLLAGAVVYLCGLALSKLKLNIVGRLVTAGVSAFLACGIIVTIAPVGWPSLFAVFFTLFWTGAIGAAFGFFVYPRIRDDSFQRVPLGRWHHAVIGLWVLYFVAGHSYSAYATHKVRSLHDPAINLVVFKWAPADGAQLQEVGSGPYDTLYPSMKTDELEELRAAGLTGTVRPVGNNSLPGAEPEVRLVLIMSRGVRETVDLPKPAKTDMIYIQTEQGWRAFPESAPTLPRTIRLSLEEPNEHHGYPDTTVTADNGLGQPPAMYGLHMFSWSADEFQAPLPLLPK